MVFYLENLRGGFCCCCSFIFVSSFHFCIFILLLLFFISFPGCFSMSPALHHDFSGPWRPPSALSSTPTTFYCLYFCIYPKRYGFEWVVFTHRFLPSFTDIFDSTCVYQGLTGSRELFLEVCRTSYWSLKHRPGPSVKHSKSILELKRKLKELGNVDCSCILCRWNH